MERAATTGWSAANRLLAHFGLAGHALHTVPVQGRSGATATARQRERQLGAMSALDGLTAKWAKTSPFKVLPRDAVGEPAADLHGCRAGDHRRRAGGDRSAGRAATGMRSPPATDPQARPLGTSVGGLRDRGVARHRRHAARRTGDLSAPRRRPGDGHGRLRRADLSVAWAAADGRPRIRLEAVSGLRRRRAGLGAAGPRRRRSSRPSAGRCRARPDGARLHAVTRLVGTCEPSDIIANRLDPWHGAWFHPYSFAAPRSAVRAARRTATSPRSRTVSWSPVTFHIGRLGVPVDRRVHQPGAAHHRHAHRRRRRARAASWKPTPPRSARAPTGCRAPR